MVRRILLDSNKTLICTESIQNPPSDASRRKICLKMSGSLNSRQYDPNQRCLAYSPSSSNTIVRHSNFFSGSLPCITLMFRRSNTDSDSLVVSLSYADVHSVDYQVFPIIDAARMTRWQSNFSSHTCAALLGEVSMPAYVIHTACPFGRISGLD